MSAQTCRRCDEVKPAAAFPNYASGVCRTCWNAQNQAWKKNNPDALDAASSKRIGDPIEFSRSTCKHVASYLERAKKTFEQQTGTEAPPFLDAILGITNNVLREHPVRRRCDECAAPISTASKTGLCRKCAGARRNRTHQQQQTDLIVEIRRYAEETGLIPWRTHVVERLGHPHWFWQHKDWRSLCKRAGHPLPDRQRWGRPVDLDGIDGTILRLRAQGLGYKAIAKQVDLTRDQVRDRLRGPLRCHLEGGSCMGRMQAA